jgi:DNA-binding MarR family transcriptional regulator
MTTTTSPDEAARVVAELARTVGSLRCAGSQLLVRSGVSMTHFHVLTLLRHHDAMPMVRLAEVLDVSMPNATGIIDRMEERGLVERFRVPDDRRIVLVRPTAAGIDLVDQAELVRSEVMANAVARLTPAQLEGLRQAARDLNASIEVELASAPDRYRGLVTCSHPHARSWTGHADPPREPASPRG